MFIDEKPGIEEQILGAVLTSDMGPDSRAADVIGALGMARSRLGSALMHLRSEWERCDKPRKRTLPEIAARSVVLKDKHGKPDMRRATVEALVAHAAALRARAMTLTGRNTVIGLLEDFARERGIDIDLCSPTLFHWLSPTCAACDGHGKMRIPDSPALSNKDCTHCRGAGEWPRPLGAQKLHDHMKSCINHARKDTVRSLYG